MSVERGRRDGRRLDVIAERGRRSSASSGEGGEGEEAKKRKKEVPREDHEGHPAACGHAVLFMLISTLALFGLFP
jgi:hypothetical protein